VFKLIGAAAPAIHRMLAVPGAPEPGRLAPETI
jgi:hypothetical protein